MTMSEMPSGHPIANAAKKQPKSGAVKGQKGFQKGVSGNPHGKKPGTKHKLPLLTEALMRGQAEALTQKAIDVALAGDAQMLKFFLDRIMPRPRSKPIEIDLPVVRTSQDLLRALDEVIQAVNDGKLLPGEVEPMMEIMRARYDLAEKCSPDASDSMLYRIEYARKYREIARNLLKSMNNVLDENDGQLPVEPPASTASGTSQ